MIRIKAISLTGQKISFEACLDETIGDLRRQVDEEMGSKEIGCLLYHCGVFLDDEEKTVGECGFIENTSLCVVSPIQGGTKIFAKTEDGKTISFEVLKTDTILDVKKKITEKVGTAPEELKLVLNGVTLDDAKKCEEYQIVENTTINVVSRKKNEMQIFAKTMDGKTVAIEIGANDTVADLKAKIQVKTGLLPDEQKLIYSGAMMDDDKKLEDYNVLEKTSVNVVARLRGGMDLRNEGTGGLFVGMIRINIISLTGLKISFEACLDETIGDLRRQVDEEMGSKEIGCLLYHCGVFLDDEEKTVGECGFIENTSLCVVSPIQGGTKIFAKTDDGKAISFEILKTDTVLDVKKKIQEKIGKAPEELKLVFNGVTLDDTKKCDEYNIVENSTLNVVTRKRNEVQIFARTMDGKTVAIEIGATETVADLKEKIQVKIGLAPDEQRLIYNGVMLSDEKTMEDYNIVDKSVLNVVARLRGGQRILTKEVDILVVR